MDALLIEFDLRTGRRAGNIEWGLRKIVKQEELDQYLANGWEVIASMPSGLVKIKKDDPGLLCHAQNTDEEDLNARGYVWQGDIPPGFRALELRIVLDGRDLSQYEGVPGVTVLRGNAAINDALDRYFEQYDYALPTREADAVLLVEALKEKGLKVSDLDLSTPRKRHQTLKDLHENKGIKLIRKIKRFEKLPV